MNYEQLLNVLYLKIPNLVLGLGVFMLFRLIPKLSWLARISIAYSVGIYAGLKLYAFMNSSILKQVQDTTIDLTKNSWGIFEDVSAIREEEREG